MLINLEKSLPGAQKFLKSALRAISTQDSDAPIPASCPFLSLCSVCSAKKTGNGSYRKYPSSSLYLQPSRVCVCWCARVYMEGFADKTPFFFTIVISSLELAGFKFEPLLPFLHVLVTLFQLKFPISFYPNSNFKIHQGLYIYIYIRMIFQVALI